ncbi:creatininase family protein [Haladaptatus sp. DYF46]|uniref:creatininase family protein n=1 Tax=Haladaptatus sp. DYF46 TaxID=2886041 RepID=UPI001E4D2205|nr:creatininase family protein [Haladaptatus sp. DYF46]
MVYETIGSSPWSWAGRTAPEIRDIADRDGSILVVPVGSIEQHGDHLPVSTDTVLVDAVTQLGAERVHDDVPLLVTPPVWSGYSPHHLPFGGTITLEYDDLLHTLEDIAGSALENGFDALLLVNGHGGNTSLISSAVSTIGVDHPDRSLLGVTYFQLAAPFIDEVRESDVGGMSHGGEFETSLMLHLRPDLVHEERFAGTPHEEPYERSLDDMFQGGPLSVYRSFDEYSDSGAIGDPTLASAEKGEEIYDRLGDELEAILRQIHDESA